MKEKLKLFIENKYTTNFILGVILYNSLILGLLTYPYIKDHFEPFLSWTSVACVIIFTIEIAIKLYVYGKKFFKDGWNNFDFFLVAISWIPTGGAFSSFRAFRVFRALRALRLITHLKKLQIIIEAIIEAIPNVMWASILLLLIFYIFSIIGVTTFGENFPVWFGTIGKSMFTLFQITTLEGWPDIAREVMKQSPLSSIYFVTFILMATFIVINVIVGVIVDAISEINNKQRRNETLNNILHTSSLEKEIKILKDQLTKVERLIESVKNID